MKCTHSRKIVSLILALLLLSSLLSACSISKPGASPTETPESFPSVLPEIAPTETPEAVPSVLPEIAPSETPSEAPTPEPSAAPANPMTEMPTPSISITEEERGLLDGVVIGIDPGHQAHANNDKEPVSPGSSETKAKVASGTQGVKTRVPEYEVNLQVGLLLREALEAQGATVYMTRDTNDIDISNVERATMMNELNADVVLRLHCNGSTNQSVSGIGLYVKSSGEGAEVSRAICDPLLAAMGEATGARTEDVHVRDIYSGLNWSTVPSILVEMGYMSNPEEDERLCSDEYQLLLVHGMTQGLIDYFNEHPVTPAEIAASEENNASSASPAVEDE